jgi:hypothetical protein
MNKDHDKKEELEEISLEEIEGVTGGDTWPPGGGGVPWPPPGGGWPPFPGGRPPINPRIMNALPSDLIDLVESLDDPEDKASEAKA